MNDAADFISSRSIWTEHGGRDEASISRPRKQIIFGRYKYDERHIAGERVARSSRAARVSLVNKAGIKATFTNGSDVPAAECNFYIKGADAYARSALISARKGTNFIVTGYKETRRDESRHLSVYKHDGGFQTRA